MQPISAMQRHLEKLMILFVFLFAGKTHVGLKIAQALLNNHEAWSNGSPMLVVCYTNHALDQFLEGTVLISISVWYL